MSSSDSPNATLLRWRNAIQFTVSLTRNFQSLKHSTSTRNYENSQPSRHQRTSSRNGISCINFAISQSEMWNLISSRNIDFHDKYFLLSTSWPNVFLVVRVISLLFSCSIEDIRSRIWHRREFEWTNGAGKLGWKLWETEPSYKLIILNSNIRQSWNSNACEKTEIIAFVEVSVEISCWKLSIC